MSHITRATLKIKQVDRQLLEVCVNQAGEHFKLTPITVPTKVADYYKNEVQVDMALIGGSLSPYGYGLVITPNNELEVVGDADMRRGLFNNLTEYITDTYSAEVMRESLINQGYSVDMIPGSEGVELVATKF